MQITFLALGSTGDILPYATLARALQDEGYRPTFVTSQDFEPLLSKLGLDGRFVAGDAQATLARAGADMRRLMLAFAQIARRLPDLLDPAAPWLRDSVAIINQLPIGLYGYDLAERLGVPHILAAVIPLTPTAEFPMMGWPTALATLPGYNKLGYWLYEFLTWQTMRASINRWRRKRLGLQATPFRGYLDRLRQQPVLNGYSSLVVPRPADWPETVHVTGYWFPQVESWRPPSRLIRFLEAGSPPVFVGFGSMPIKDPQAMTSMIAEAAVSSGRRVVLQSGWAGIGQGDLPDTFYKLDYAPYGWLFPRMAAVIHHGGSGTTAANVRAGVPGLIVPFTFDQSFWGRRLADLGVGLSPIPFSKLTATMLADSILHLASNQGMKERAAELGQRIQSENGIPDAIRLLTGYLCRPEQAN